MGCSEKKKREDIQAPPDGGWAWVILAGMLIGLINWSGVMRCYSVFFVHLMSEFDAKYSDVAWLNGLYEIGYGLSCPLTPLMVRKTGYRPLTIASSLVATCSFLIGSQSSTLWGVQLFIGLIPGLCMGPVMLCGFTTVSRYFSSRRNVATQILCAAFTIGGFVFCPIYQLLIDCYGWRGAFQIIAGFFLQICVMGALMKPIVLEDDFAGDQSAVNASADDKKKEDKNNNSKPLLKAASEDADDVERTQDCDVIVACETGASAAKESAVRKWCRRYDLHVLEMPIFHLYYMSWVLFAAGYYSALTYLVPYGRSVGLDDMKATWLMSATMIGEAGSRVLYGWKFDRIPQSRRILYAAAMECFLATAFLTMLIVRGFAAMLVCCAAIGLTGGGMDGVFSIFIVDMFGLKLYPAVYGYSNIPIHLLGMAATVVIGKCIDLTGALHLTFYVGIGAALSAAIITVLMDRVNRNNHRRRTTAHDHPS